MVEKYLENDDGPSLIVAATNHPELLDKALFRRFDDVITYGVPTPEVTRGILEAHLATFKLDQLQWPSILDASVGLSQAEIARAADEAAKVAVLADTNQVGTAALAAALGERKASAL
jgi:ATP-dependent 26S proteasome regulatory subunit